MTFSSSVFAIIICLSVSFEIVSAWQNNCRAGDICLDTTGHPPLPAGTTCKMCSDWVSSDSTDIRCKCCCGSSPPTPGSPPSPPLPPPAPQDPSEFEGGMPHSYKICTAGQESVDIKHVNGIECIHESKCEQECKTKGLAMAGKECLSAGSFYPTPTETWYEQCCCEKIPPPPPPAPCPCENTCCNPDVNIQISVSIGQKLS
ncbi:hypothetical protein MKW94_004337 [Papaver nudicaule]|uniref:Secreted protein n=1 Tax=Papaver nudicaule TaxID=74823 RepID=A0AA41SFR9_PAPNU|nr:hypothetical protein [Papaver nudicaule]